MTTNDIASRSERLLEYPKILALLAERANSEGAKAMALALRPEEYSEDADRLQALTEAAVKISAKRGSPSFRMLKDVSPAIARVELGGVLSMRELLEIKAGTRTEHTEWIDLKADPMNIRQVTKYVWNPGSHLR